MTPAQVLDEMKAQRKEAEALLKRAKALAKRQNDDKLRHKQHMEMLAKLGADIKAEKAALESAEREMGAMIVFTAVASLAIQEAVQANAPANRRLQSKYVGAAKRRTRGRQ
ncbi:MAG: hypothetical protein SGILL_005352 [Bacillariaceae sp.]